MILGIRPELLKYSFSYSDWMVLDSEEQGERREEEKGENKRLAESR